MIDRYIILGLLFTISVCGPKTRAEDTSLRFPDTDWQRVDLQSPGISLQKLHQARDYALTGGGAGMITYRGELMIAWGDTRRKFDLKSTSKSIGVTTLGLAIGDGKISLDDHAIKHHPDFANHPKVKNQRWRELVTIRQLATQSAGFKKPGGYEPFLFAPGSRWHYSDGGPNWMAECVTLAMQQDIESLLFDRVLTPIGITKDDLHWRRNAYREKTIEQHRRCEMGSGVHANVDAMARIGLLYLNRGRWKDRQLLPQSFVDEVSKPASNIAGLVEWDSEHGDASEHYGLLWWNNGDGTISDVPRDAFWSWGLHESLIVVLPSLHVVASRAGRDWQRKKNSAHYDVLAPFLKSIVAAVPTRTNGDQANSPYPQSSVVAGVRWDPATQIKRAAQGSDNWPMAWLDDESLLAAYGDGWGFKPKTKKKLSLGLARIEGDPHDFRGVNVRSPSGEQTGDGAKGRKASGMIMVDDTLYMLVRNASNSTLAWSPDRGITWHWAKWNFETSFGCPSFIDFGRANAWARDEFVYVVSTDSDSAYKPADRMVLARVHRDRIKDRDAYEFLFGLDADGEPHWTSAIQKRSGVFFNPGRCYRGNMVYNAPMKRFFWCQTLPESTHPQGPRFQGGFGIYEAPNPWGPWSTVFFTESWDVGPGESSSIPSKWISADGKTLHLVFSGDDSFSVRRGVLQLGN